MFQDSPKITQNRVIIHQPMMTDPFVCLDPKEVVSWLQSSAVRRWYTYHPNIGPWTYLNQDWTWLTSCHGGQTPQYWTSTCVRNDCPIYTFFFVFPLISLLTHTLLPWPLQSYLSLFFIPLPCACTCSIQSTRWVSPFLLFLVMWSIT
jgi:hypothetical protein